MRVVLDTNIIVSAYLNEDGQPFRVLKLGLAGVINLYASEAILDEYKELPQRPRAEDNLTHKERRKREAQLKTEASQKSRGKMFADFAAVVQDLRQEEG